MSSRSSSPRSGPLRRNRSQQIAEGHVLVDARLVWQPEDPFTDEVALDLVDTTTDRDHVSRRDDLEGAVVEQRFVARQRPVRALEVERCPAETVQAGEAASFWIDIVGADCSIDPLQREAWAAAWMRNIEMRDTSAAM